MHILVNFFGSVAIMPVMNRLNELYEMLDAMELGEAFDAQSFFLCLAAVASYMVLEYAVVVVGLVILFKAIKEKKHRLPLTAEMNIPSDRVASTVICNVGTIIFLASAVAFIILDIVV